MTDHNDQNNSDGQAGIDQETERRNRENETGQQNQTPAEPTANESESGFVGSDGDQSGDYLTKGENDDFQPEGQGASDSDAGDADITTGQPTSSDSTLDDGSDTSR